LYYKLYSIFTREISMKPYINMISFNSFSHHHYIFHKLYNVRSRHLMG